MTQIETPAQALNALIKRCLDCNDQGSITKALTAISDASTRYELLQFISIADRLIAGLLRIIETSELDEEQKTDVRSALTSFRGIFSLEVMSAGWMGIKGNAFPPHHVQTLKMLGPGIKSVASQKELSSIEVKELEEEASSLLDLMEASSIDAKVKNLIISHLRLIMFHLANYRIGGKKELRNATSFVAGDIMAFREACKSESKDVEERRFFRFVGKIINRLRTVSDDIERLEEVPKNIDMITDLFGGSTSG